MISERSIAEEIRSYLAQLEKVVPSSTVQSHKRPLKSLADRFSSLPRNSGRLEHITAELIMGWLVDSCHGFDSVRGFVTSLANFIAYVYEDSPSVVTSRILSELYKREQEHDGFNQQTLREIAGSRYTPPSTEIIEGVESLLSHLRRSQFAKRTHVCVEILIATCVPVKIVQQINRRDIDPEVGTLEVGISDNHVVGSLGLVESRSARFGDPLTEAIEEYLEYERTDPRSHEDALLTTSYGRASRDTLRRSIKQASEEATSSNIDLDVLGDTPADLELPKNDGTSVKPSDIRRYALSRVVKQT